MFNAIRPYITKDEPFGPIDSGDIEMTGLKALLLDDAKSAVLKSLKMENDE